MSTQQSSSSSPLLRIDLVQMVIKIDEVPIKLTRTEFGIISVLARRWPGVATHEMIAQEIDSLDIRYHKWHMQHIRKKGFIIDTRRGYGYQLNMPVIVGNAPTLGNSQAAKIAAHLRTIRMCLDDIENMIPGIGGTLGKAKNPEEESVPKQES